MIEIWENEERVEGFKITSDKKADDIIEEMKE